MVYDSVRVLDEVGLNQPAMKIGEYVVKALCGLLDYQSRYWFIYFSLG